MRNVVLVGGGHAHALVLRRWAMKPVAGARVTVINPGPTAPYTGMLPGFVAGHYTREELDIDLVKLARFAGTRLVLGAVTEIDRDAKTVTVPGRPPIPYDICSINVGITSHMAELPGFAEHAVGAKPLGRFADEWVAFLDSLAANNADKARVAILGGGVGGSELAMAMRFRLAQAGITPEVTIVDRSTVLANVGERARLELRKTLAGQGITFHEGVEVTSVSAHGVELADRTIEADFVVGAAGARPHGWLSNLGLDMHEGFIVVDETLRSTSDSSIFAAGDCAHMAFAPRPKAGVFAVRQAPILNLNIQAMLTGGALKTFEPQTDYLKLISLGDKVAAAAKYGRLATNPGMWRLKDKIDRDFMNKLGDLPKMERDPIDEPSVTGLAEAVDGEPPLCGGCGAKVGIDVLHDALSEIAHDVRPDVTQLPGDDAALLTMGATNQVKQVLTTDQLRSFTPDPYRMARIATLHAFGDVWAMGANPQAVLVTVTLPQLSTKLQGEWLREIMAGTGAALEGTGAEIVGGHTSMGAELTIGYSVTGLVDGEPITLAGAEPGQALVLSRPIGSGVLFAAEMHTEAHGSNVAALLDELERPQAQAATLLARAGATAMTDVTGFGLAGHLFGFCRESGVSATLRLDDIDFFAGAIAAAQAGTRSHLYASNAASVPAVRPANDPRAGLMFDPQTAGGMLAAVPADSASYAVDQLRAAGYQASVVGEIHEGAPKITIRAS